MWEEGTEGEQDLLKVKKFSWSENSLVGGDNGIVYHNAKLTPSTPVTTFNTIVRNVLPAAN